MADGSWQRPQCLKYGYINISELININSSDPSARTSNLSTLQ